MLLCATAIMQTTAPIRVKSICTGPTIERQIHVPPVSPEASQDAGGWSYESLKYSLLCRVLLVLSADGMQRFGRVAKFRFGGCLEATVPSIMPLELE